MVEQMLHMGYTSFTEISQCYVYSFTEEKFLKDGEAAQKFGWNLDDDQAIEEKRVRDMENEIGHVQDSMTEEVLAKRG